MTEKWGKIDRALNSELESFDQFMTAQSIEGDDIDRVSSKEIKKVEEILESSIPERFVQEKLLDKHIRQRSS